MNTLEITRTIHGTTYQIPLTTEELEQAYRIKKRLYTEADLTNAVLEETQNPNFPFHVGHLAEFPEIVEWLHDELEKYDDSNLGYNEQLSNVIYALMKESKTPAFFYRLACKAPAFCIDGAHNPVKCEADCSRYYHCPQITEADDRSKCWERIASSLSMHLAGNCSCRENDKPCAVSNYLNGIWDINTLYYFEKQGEE